MQRMKSLSERGRVGLPVLPSSLSSIHSCSSVYFFSCTMHTYVSSHHSIRFEWLNSQAIEVVNALRLGAVLGSRACN